MDFNGDMRDPRDRTWLALLGLQEDHLRVVRLDPTGRSGLQACLRDADPILQRAEAVGMDFAFGLPLSFASSLLGGEFPDEGWWALAKRLEKMSRPEFLGAVQDFLQESGELHRHTDEKTGAHSPLHQGKEDTGAMCYHGIRIIAEEHQCRQIGRRALGPGSSAGPDGRCLSLALSLQPGCAGCRAGRPLYRRGGDLRRGRS